MASVRWLLLLLAACAFPALALTPPPPAAVRDVASGFVFPVEIADAHDGSGRLFVCEQGGRIMIARNGAMVATPFLDITSRIAQGGERGLLGLVFDPQFATNRRFFVYYTLNPSGDLRISSFLASATNPDLADSASESEVITISHSAAANHNGGHMAFGPDGFLYAGTGDGGGGGDPLGNGQNLTTLLGKLLRLDVSGPSGYAIPAGNPTYPGVTGARREVWAWGLRNPWRWSFDRATGDLYIGDVGQNLIEEVDYLPVGTPGGVNFGWNVTEGNSCYNATTCTLPPGYVPPVLTYNHDSTGGFSITGGFVYRGSGFPALRGWYVYADYVSGRVWAAQQQGGVWANFVLFEPPSAVFAPSTFGEDANGEIYVTTHAAVGKIQVLVQTDTAIPGAPTPIAPMGTITTAAPTYSWNAVPGAASYVLLVQNTTGVRVSTTVTAVAAGCPAGSGVCSLTPGVALAGNTPYNWFVRATNTMGTGAWSPLAAIFVGAGVGGGPPAVPATISPSGTITTSGPTYTWSPAAGATSYNLLVQNTAGVAVSRAYMAADVGCASGMGTCSVMPAEMLADNTYNWFVNAANANGTSAWSATRTITVTAGTLGGLPGAPMPVAPIGTVTMGTPAYTWNAVSGATSYYLLVQNTAGVVVGRSFSPMDAGCAMGMDMCSVMPANALAGNTPYMWFVNASNASGMGPWSAGLPVVFSSPTGPPAAPVAMSPSGTLMTNMPMYVWNAVPGATSYYLLVQNTMGVAVSAAFNASAVGCDSGMGMCSVTPMTALAPNTPYAWFVNATGTGGTSAWSAGIMIQAP